MPPSVQLESGRRFLDVACELKLLAPGLAGELLSEAETRGLLPSQLIAQRGLLTATQVEIVETLCAPREAVPGYETLGLIGHGGMGVVYRARHLALQRVVALKTVLLSELDDPSALKRFELEATLAARLAHPHVVTVYDFGRHAGRVFYAMELVDGEDADRLLRRAGPLDERLAWSIVRQAASGLAHAAELGIVHRDVKPANLLLVEPPTGFPLPQGVPLVKVADFGLARLTQDEQQRTRLTADASAVGSLLYMAPEQLEAEAPDAKADLYALGATAYHLLSGQPPLAGRTPGQIMAAKLSGKIPDLRQLRPEVHPASAELVLALMALAPARRPANYSTLIERIDRLPLKPLEADHHWVPPRRAAGAPARALAEAVTAKSPLAATEVLAPPPRTRLRWRRTWLSAGAAIGFLGLMLALWLASRPAQIERDLVPTGRAEYLFDGQKIDQWLPLSGGWFPRTDEEGGLVLEGQGDVRRVLAAHDSSGRLEALSHYRLILFLYFREASAVEVQFDLASTERGTPRQFVRIAPEGSRLGSRRDEHSAPAVSSALVPLALAAERPHVIQIERHRGGWWVLVDEQLVGAVRGQNALPAAEFRVRVEGGAAWISDVTIEELAPPPKK